MDRYQYEFVRGLYNEKSWNIFPPWINLSFGFDEFLWDSKIRANFTMWLEGQPDNDITKCFVWRTLNNQNVSVDGWKGLRCISEQPVVCQKISSG